MDNSIEPRLRRNTSVCVSVFVAIQSDVFQSAASNVGSPMSVSHGKFVLQLRFRHSFSYRAFMSC